MLVDAHRETLSLDRDRVLGVMYGEWGHLGGGDRWQGDRIGGQLELLPGDDESFLGPGSLSGQREPQQEMVLEWDPPADLGGFAVTYQVLRSINPLNFMSSTVCLPLAQPSNPIAVDDDNPTLGGAAFCYLVRAVNDCPDNRAPLGRSSDAAPRWGMDCP